MRFCDEDTHFDGSDYNHSRDFVRLEGQIAEIYHLMKDGEWRTLTEIEEELGHPQASISAQLRNLRKARFGGYTVHTMHIKRGLYKYRLDTQRAKFNTEKKQEDKDFALQVFDDVLSRNSELARCFKELELNLIRKKLGA